MSSTHHRVSPIQRGLVAIFVVAVLAVTELPYRFAYATTPADKQFMGILLNVPDSAQYLSWAREFSSSWLIENKLTPEPGEAVFFNLFWLVVGRTARAFSLGLAETTQLARLASGAVYLFALFWLSGLFLKNPLHQWIGYLVLSLGGGLGWLMVVAKQVTGILPFPLDLYVTEPNTFLSVMAFPHQAMATGILVAILGLAAVALEKLNLRLAAIGGILGLLLGVQHGYDLLVVYAIVGASALFLAWNRAQPMKTLAVAALICGPSGPVALYLYFLTKQSPIWSGVLAQYGNAGVYTPSPLHLMILMGVPLMIVIGARPEPTHSMALEAREVLLRVWLVVGFLLLYIPTDFQIKMLAGWQVPVGILATRIIFEQAAPAMSRVLHAGIYRSSAIMGTMLLLAAIPVNGYLYAWRFVELGRHDYPYFLSKDEIAAMTWLEMNSKPYDVVLSSLTLGQYIPGTTGNRAFLAHWAQTLDFFEKRAMVERFFGSRTSEAENLDLIRNYRVGYILYGDQERALGNHELVSFPHSVRTYSSGHVSIFRVERPPDEDDDYALSGS